MAYMESDNAVILIVEDDDLLSTMYKTKFESEGFKVIVAGDGLAGFEMAKKHLPKVILLDVMLPKLSGTDLLAQLKKAGELSKIPVVMLSNLSSEETIREAEGRGAQEYVVKANSTPQQIVDIVKKYL